MITLTDTAAIKVKELLTAEGADDLALRVAVRPGGCSGFSYEMFFDGDIAADDEQATTEHGRRRYQAPVADTRRGQRLRAARRPSRNSTTRPTTVRSARCSIRPRASST